MTVSAGTIALWKRVDLHGILDTLTPPGPAVKADRPPKIFTKEDIRSLLDSSAVVNLTQKTIERADPLHHFKITTTLNVALQKHILKKLERLEHISRGIPRFMALVAMEPDTGRILAMVNFDQDASESGPSVVSVFPAASIFKIITATAAIETCGLTPSSILKYNGGKYTLYKTQLREKNNRYTQRISLKNAFAQSVNPVFGKLGALNLGKSAIEKYADAFGFNSPIDFEILLSPSVISLSDTPYHLAEIACGFNRTTRISPLHGAMLGSAILNNGKIMEPTIVENIADADGTVIYNHTFNPLNQAMRPSTSREIKTLMKSTICSGTGRKAFRGYKSDTVLSRLTIGGKTGTISNRQHDVRYDWFVGFAEEKKGKQKIAVAVVVGHQKYIGTRATEYARMAITNFFKTHFAANDADASSGKHRT